jgi:enoyl-CoA hydratase/carnithine racemase
MIEIRMDAPRRNAISTDMMRFLLRRLDEAESRPLLLTGTGESFSSGLDLKEVASLDIGAMETFFRLLDLAVERLYTHPAPTVALVNGHAIAGGCVLALACDHRVAVDEPRFRIGLNEVALGLRYPPRILAMIRHRVPPQHLERVVLGAALCSPVEALALGLLDEVSSDPRPAAEARLAALAALPPSAYAATKRDLRGSVMAPVAKDEERFVSEVLPTWVAPEVRTRIAQALAR